jgi:hypothetical protein
MIDKRKTFTQITKAINIISWIIAFILLILIDKARPPFETFLNRLKNMPLRKTWDSDIMQNAFYFLVVLFLLSIFSIMINTIAYKKESYNFRFSSIFLSLSSLLGIILYFINF